MRYNISIDFDCDEHSYIEHIGDSISTLLNATLPYMVDNVDINHFVYEDEGAVA